jgi:flagellar L-ring protein precursor FlgH
MKTSIYILIILAVTSAVPAQDKQGKKKKQPGPELKVVSITEPPPTPPEPVVTRPANGSLFSDDARNGDLVRDFKARQVGDLVFIDVVEVTTATVASSATRSRDSGNLAGAVPLIAALPIGGAATASTVAGELGQRKFDGKGTTGRTSSVKGRITARVLEVLPNGDLRVEAVKMVKINKETEKLAVTGIVRQSDLGGDNSVPTVRVGDLRVEFNGKGVASADNGPGWLFRLFDKLSPF